MSFNYVIKITFINFSLIFSNFIFSQQIIKPTNTFLDINLGLGQVISTKKQIYYLTKQPTYVCILGYNKQTKGREEWERIYNYPSYGVSCSYQDFNQPILGSVYGIYAHYTQYFYNRKLAFRIADGLAYATHPFNKKTNHKNRVLGSRILNGFYMQLQYNEQRIWKGLGVQGGFLFTHYSNGKVKALNLGLNSYLFQLGINYSFEKEHSAEYLNYEKLTLVINDSKINYNFVLRAGVNEVVTSGMYKPSYTFSFYADKPLSKIRTLYLGADYFESYFLKERIKYEMLQPQNTYNKVPDYRRAGLFIGHDLVLNKLSILTQIGYYLYNPYHYKSNWYQRLGLKYQMNKSLFSSLTLKSHRFQAEVIEFGIGIKL